MFHRNYNRCRRRRNNHFSQIHQPKSNPCCLAWSKQQESAAVKWMQIKQSLFVPPDRTWNNVNDPKVNYSSDLRERKVGHEPEAWALLLYACYRPT